MHSGAWLIMALGYLAITLIFIAGIALLFLLEDGEDDDDAK